MSRDEVLDRVARCPVCHELVIPYAEIEAARTPHPLIVTMAGHIRDEHPADALDHFLGIGEVLGILAPPPPGE